MNEIENKQGEIEKNWLDEMIIREALPPTLRNDTVEDFCQKWSVARSTYYYQASKTENQDEILKIARNNAKKYTAEVLDNLGQRALEDNKAAEMYLKFILELSEKTDLNVKGGIILNISKEIADKNVTTSSPSDNSEMPQ